MTRYSKHPNAANRKNTLVTIMEGDTIFFGISRCNMHAGDKFLKAKGKLVAKARAEKAFKEFAPLASVMAKQGEFELNAFSNGLRGFVHHTHVPELLEYFRNIDKALRHLEGTTTLEG